MDHYVGDKEYNPAMPFDPKLENVLPEYRDIVAEAVTIKCQDIRDKLKDIFGTDQVWKCDTGERTQTLVDSYNSLGPCTISFD